MPRALHVLGSLNPGGVERWLLDTVRRRGESSWQFDFCLLGAGRGAWAGRFEALGCRALCCPLAPRRTFIARLYTLLRRERYDVVHSHVHCFSGVILAVARAAGVPVRVAHSHTCDAPARERPGRRIYRGAMRALLETSMTAGFACAAGAAGFAGERVRARLRILPCGIDLEAFRRHGRGRSGLRRQLGILGDAPVVGHVGRLAEEKNQAFLLRAAARLVERVPRARLVIAGGGCLRAGLEDLARRFGLRQRVIFTGPREDVLDLLDAFDAFALPSLREGLPAVVLEAQAAGLPCVVSEQVPPEAVVMPELVERVGLDRGADAWAGALASALAKPRGSRTLACLRLGERGLDVAGAFGALTEVYEEGAGLPRRASCTPASDDPPVFYR
jgi:glycosyltransferase involved in cell wall biosynthesis